MRVVLSRQVAILPFFNINRQGGYPMLRFIVLGLVPGTNIQVTFDMFLQLLGVIITAYLVFALVKLEYTKKTETNNSEPTDFELVSL